MSIKYEPVMAVSLTSQIAEQIRQSITDGTLKVDEQLPTEEEMARQFKVSRPTIREALKRLGAQSLIRSRRGPAGGNFVNRPNHEEMRVAMTTATAVMVSLGEFGIPSILEARQALGSMCIEYAVERREQAELAIMAEELARQQNNDLSDVDFCASDVRFHRAIVDATHNPVLMFVMFSVIEALQPIKNIAVLRFRERAVIVKQHERLYEAIRYGDTKMALDAVAEQNHYMSQHFGAAMQTA